jgi:hypothetical protein
MCIHSSLHTTTPLPAGFLQWIVKIIPYFSNFTFIFSTLRTCFLSRDDCKRERGRGRDGKGRGGEEGKLGSMKGIREEREIKLPQDLSKKKR